MFREKDDAQKMIHSGIELHLFLREKNYLVLSCSYFLVHRKDGGSRRREHE